jgi:hypothetical protein
LRTLQDDITATDCVQQLQLNFNSFFTGWLQRNHLHDSNEAEFVVISNYFTDKQMDLPPEHKLIKYIALLQGN